MKSFEKLREEGFKQLSQGAAYCGIPTIGFSSASLTGSSTIDSISPVIALLGAFLMAGVWMFRRWGASPEPQVLPEPSPGVTVSARQAHEPTNS